MLGMNATKGVFSEGKLANRSCLIAGLLSASSQKIQIGAFVVKMFRRATQPRI